MVNQYAGYVYQAKANDKLDDLEHRRQIKAKNTQHKEMIEAIRETDIESMGAVMKPRQKKEQPRHPVTGQVKKDWKKAYAEKLGGKRGTPDWQVLLDKAEDQWMLDNGLEYEDWPECGTPFLKSGQSYPKRRRVRKVSTNPVNNDS